MSKNKIVLIIIILGVLLATFATYQCDSDYAQNDLVQSSEESPWHALLCILMGPKQTAF
jgi:hypothetical protein